MRLSNQTIIVHGAQRSALYRLDHSKGAQIQRIPSDIAQLLEHDLPPQSATQKRWLEYCVHARFAERDTPMFWEKFTPDWSYCLNRELSTMSFDIGVAGPSAAILPWLQQSKYRQLHFVFFLSEPPDQACMREICHLVRDAQAASFELQIMDAKEYIPIIESIIFNARGQAIAKRLQYNTSTKDVTLLDHLDPSLQLYLLQTHFSESRGQIHIDAGLTIWPHQNERHYALGALGDIASLPLDALFATPQWKHISSATKDSRQKCRDCELRYACLSDYTDRSSASDLHSAPRNCAYDPTASDWQKQLFNPHQEVASSTSVVSRSSALELVS